MDARQGTEKKVFSYMEKHHMLKAHDRVVAGISGGADSVCLLFVLLEWAKCRPLSLAVVHVNHQIRPEAQQDADYVEELCREQGICFYPFSVDVRQRAAREGISEEEAGRCARYEAFEQAAKDFGADRIAVAHNSNDRAETMLFHLFRGSGIRGLGSIRPVRDRIIRPILCLERREVEAYLTERNILYCRDATNGADDYTRNRIRHHILPFAEQKVSQGCIGHMAQTADMLTEIEEYLEQQTRQAMETCVTGNAIEKAPFLRLHGVIQQRILHQLLLSLSPRGRDISFVHIRDLQDLFYGEGSREVCLPFGIVGKRRYDRVILVREQNGQGGNAGIPPTDIPCMEIPLFFPFPEGEEPFRKVSLGDMGMLELRLLSGESVSADFPRNRYTKWLDYDKMEQSLSFRTRRKGDYLTIAGQNGEISHKTVKDYMITEKIPREDRDRIPLLAQGSHVIWLIGYRISEYYKISRNTKHILQVQLKRNCFGRETEDKDG